MNITCKAAPKTGTIISILTDEGRLVDSFRAPTRNGLLYCVAHRTSKFTRRLQHGVEVALRFDEQDAANDHDHAEIKAEHAA